MTRAELIRAVSTSTSSPANKRQVLAMLGVKTEYVVHQGAKEMARRLKKMNRNKD